MAQALIIFVRNPEWGAVKTRLAATLGNDMALSIYRRLLEHTLTVTGHASADRFVFYAGSIPDYDIWEAAGCRRLLQQEGTLGEKMKAAFDVVFSMGYQEAIIIGSDCFELTPQIISEAFRQLATFDTVIGPANDGGYYLLGMKQLHEELFSNKEWSTETVYLDTKKDLERLQLPCFVLPELIDIDTEEDWNAVQGKDETSRLA